MADKKSKTGTEDTFDTETGGEVSDTTISDVTTTDPLSSVDSEVPMGTFGEPDTTTAGTMSAADMDLDTTDTTMATPPVAADVAASAAGVVDQVKDKASQVASQTKEQVGQALAQGKEQAQQAIAQGKEQVGQVLAQGKEQAGQVFDQTKSQIVGQLSDQKTRAADGLAGVVTAIQQAAVPFRDNNVPYVADYAESFAGQIDKVTQYLRDNDIEDLTSDVAAYARKNPTLFVGGAFVLGLGIARFLKSSGTRASASAYNYDKERSHALVPLDEVSHSVPVAGRTGTSAGYIGSPGADDNVSDEIGEKPLHASNYVAGVGIVNTPPANV